MGGMHPREPRRVTLADAGTGRSSLGSGRRRWPWRSSACAMQRIFVESSRLRPVWKVDRMARASSRSVVRLLPAPPERCSLRGLYLGHQLRSEIRDGRAFCFSNFVVSLDGRVSLSSSPEEPPTGVPPGLASSGDWRLFQELVAQSDAVLVSGRYVREVAAGRAEPLVQFDRPGMDDLLAWRRAAGLAGVPDVVVMSSSVDVDPTAAHRLGPRVIVVTGADAPSERAAVLRDAGIEVVVAGRKGGVEGRRLAGVRAGLGYRTV